MAQGGAQGHSQLRAGALPPCAVGRCILTIFCSRAVAGRPRCVKDEEAHPAAGHRNCRCRQTPCLTPALPQCLPSPLAIPPCPSCALRATMTTPSSTASSRTLWCRVRRVAGPGHHHAGMLGRTRQSRCKGCAGSMLPPFTRVLCDRIKDCTAKPLLQAGLRAPAHLLPLVWLPGGDPTGTGNGGESIYGHPFKCALPCLHAPAVLLRIGAC